jgi:hypothetical protein
MVVGQPEPGKARSSAPFIAFLLGEAILLAAFVALARSPDHSLAYYVKLIAVEVAAVALAIATEHRYAKERRRA